MNSRGILLSVELTRQNGERSMWFDLQRFRDKYGCQALRKSEDNNKINMVV